MHALRRWAALTIKEFQQLRRNKQLLIQLLVPPSVALVIFGYALNPEVKRLRMGVVDESQTQASRDLISALTANEAFQIHRWYASGGEAEEALRHAWLDLVVLIPSDYARKRSRGFPAEVQVWTDAVNANTASIAQAYLTQAGLSTLSVPKRMEASSVTLFNPGNVHSWYFLTGILSVMVFINCSLTAAALTVREKELGTIEQLLMSPAQTVEVLLAKTVPVLLMGMMVLTLGTTVGRLVFGLPMRGSVLLLGAATSCAAIAGIGIGITVATFAATQQQGQMMAFFMMPPLVLISGAFAPIESMPVALRALSYLDPLRYMVRTVRGIYLKGAGLDLLWPQIGALALFSVVLYGISAWRFRAQLR
jgi:ABC-2 type transport system permease protein